MIRVPERDLVFGICVLGFAILKTGKDVGICELREN